jgi:proteasome lid subunit RPN8/RPN11
MPELFEVLALNGDGLDKAPYPTVPYYIHAVEGDFLYRDTQIGTVLLKETTKPKSLGRIGFANGVFSWKGEKIPASIISQAHDFFLRTFNKHHAEAEVFITMHNETGAFRLFVPYQRVNHMGVKSVYEPTHVSRDYTVVGTLHSHCDFGAFHSGTDSGDASDMDGVHFTIGKVNSAQPEIVAMVTMAGKEFHYKDPAEIANIAFGTETAPAWWDQYVYPAETASEKPKSLKSLTQAQWDEFRGIVQARPKHGTISHLPVPSNASKWLPRQSQSSYKQNNWERSTDWRDYVYGAQTSESRDFNKRMRRMKKRDTNVSCGDPKLDLINATLDVAEEAGLFSDDDWKMIRGSEMEDPAFWAQFFLDRMSDLVTILELLDVEVEFSTSPKGA